MLCLKSRNDCMEHITCPCHHSRWCNVNNHKNVVLKPCQILRSQSYRYHFNIGSANVFLHSYMCRVTPLTVNKDSLSKPSGIFPFSHVSLKQSKLHSLLLHWLFTKVVSSSALLASDLKFPIIIDGREGLNLSIHLPCITVTLMSPYIAYIIMHWLYCFIFLKHTLNIESHISFIVPPFIFTLFYIFSILFYLFRFFSVLLLDSSLFYLSIC